MLLVIPLRGDKCYNTSNFAQLWRLVFKCRQHDENDSKRCSGPRMCVRGACGRCRAAEPCPEIWLECGVCGSGAHAVPGRGVCGLAGEFGGVLRPGVVPRNAPVLAGLGITGCVDERHRDVAPQSPGGVAGEVDSGGHGVPGVQHEHGKHDGFARRRRTATWSCPGARSASATRRT